MLGEERDAWKKLGQCTDTFKFGELFLTGYYLFAWRAITAARNNADPSVRN